jgi:Ca2+-binding RTX toxin-like protein
MVVSTLLVDGGILNGTSDADTLTFGNGTDYLTGQIFGSGGNDSINSQASTNILPGVQLAAGNTGNDTLNFSLTSATPVELYGGQGNDSIIGSAGGLGTLIGGEGTDTIATVATNTQTNTIYGGTQPGGNQSADAADVINSLGSGSDFITGNLGNDTITDANGASDTIYGGLGDDNITVNGTAVGTDSVIGGEGADVINAGGSSTNAIIYGGVQPGGNQSSDGADTITGGTGSDTITGNLGNDVIATNTGINHEVYGGLDNDSITATSSLGGTDTLYGGEGADTIDASGSQSNAVIYGGTQPGADQTNDGADSILGSAANDFITSNLGNDTIVGNAGNDTMYGGAGNDTIDGGAGDDILYGNAGNDTLTGGGGNDIFRFSVPGDISGPANVDILTDFASGADKVQLATGLNNTFTGLNFSTATTVNLTTITITGTATNFNELFAEIAANTDALNLTASTDTILRAANVVVGAGTFAGTHLLVNDGTQGVTTNDLLVAKTGAAGPFATTDINFAAFT